MPSKQFTHAELFELLKIQEDREAERRERLRQAVAESEPPLSGELAQAVIALNDKHTRAILRDHKGFKLAQRRDSYLTSLAIAEQGLQDLLAAICSFEAAALAEGSELFDESGRGDLRNIERQIQKELFATANAAASLVDHARRVHKCHEVSGYDAKRLECFGTDGLHEFVIGLRVMLHHLHLVEAGWSIQKNFSEGTETATFKVEKHTVQRVIAENKDGFPAPARKAMCAYVEAAPDSIDLRAVFLDYRARLTKFHSWMKKELESNGLVALRDYDDLIRRKVAADQRMQWNALLGNWLNWKNPPNPHKHLPRYLRPEQLEAVYKLPRNSKEQVDLVITFMDTTGIVDEQLRQQAYQLFERSPPAS
jgi:hypothetical protein